MYVYLVEMKGEEDYYMITRLCIQCTGKVMLFYNVLHLLVITLSLYTLYVWCTHACP